MPMPRKMDPIKHCEACGKRMARKRYRGTLEDLSAFRRRHYCNQGCMARGMTGVIKHLTEQNSRRQSAKARRTQCEKCGRADSRLYAHHKDRNPLNNAAPNLQTLCGSCHRRSHSRHWSATLNQREACIYCSQPARQRGLCWTHLTRYKKYGDPLVTKIKVGSTWILSKVEE